MIKFVYCLTRHPRLGPAEFQAYWRDRHGPYIRSLAKTLGAVRYVQSHTLDSPLNAGIAASRGLETPAYDGVTEIWWRSVGDFEASISTPEGAAAARDYIADEANFVDFARSRAFVTVEVTIFDLEAPAAAGA